MAFAVHVLLRASGAFERCRGRRPSCRSSSLSPSKLKKMPWSSQAEANSPIFYYEYQKSLFEEIRENISELTKEEIENLATPPPGMSHMDLLYLLECCMFRFGITTVA